MDCVDAHSPSEWHKTKYLSAFRRGMVVDARHTGLSVSRTATLLFFVVVAQQFPMCIKNRPPPKGQPENLTTVGSIGVNMGQNPCGTLSTLISTRQRI
jgi:hypothetical protein